MAGSTSYDLGLGRSKSPSVPERLTEIQDGAPLAGTPRKEPTIEDVSRETGVPWNIIETVVQDSGVKPEQSLALARDFAQKMKAQIETGQDIPGAMRTIFGDDAPIEDALERAVILAGGDQGRAASGQNSFAEDAGRAVLGGAITGVGAIAEGAGTLLDVDDLFGDPGFTDFFEDAGRAVAGTLQGWGKNVKDGMSDDAKRAVRNSTPKGRLFDPSTWEFDGDVSAKGIALLTADVLGSLAPVVIAGAFTGGVGGAVVGGLQGAGSGSQTGREIVNRATHEQLEANSAYYNDLIAKGMDRKEAKAKVADAAGSLAAVFAAPVAGAGGAFTGRLVQKGLPGLATSNLGTRVAGTAAVGAVEEGGQEVMEGVAARSGAELASGLPVDQMEGTFGEFVLGALGGGAIGAGRGALPVDSEDEDGADLNAAPDAPLGLPAPDPQLPPPDGEPETPSLERPPLGPLSRAAQAAPPPQPAPEPTVNAQPGQTVRVTLAGGQAVDAEYIGEDEAGVNLKVNGEPVLISPERMAQDRVEIEPVDALSDASWDGVETTADTNFVPLDDTTEPPEKRGPRLQGIVDTYLSDQQIDADANDRAEIINSINRLGGTVDQAVADFLADRQMEALAQEREQIAPVPQPGKAENVSKQPPPLNREGGLLTENASTDQEPVKKLDGTEWGSMAPQQRTDLLSKIGFADASGNLNAPGRRAAGKEWDALSERVREKLSEQIDPQAQAGAPVAPGADPNRGLGQSNALAIEAPAERPARTQPGVNVLPDGEEPLVPPAQDGQAQTDEEGAVDRVRRIWAGMKPSERAALMRKGPYSKAKVDTYSMRKAPPADIDDHNTLVRILKDGGLWVDAPGSVAAAALETEEQPTEGQKEAENYKTGKAAWQGLKLSIENMKGTERSKKTPDGKNEWSVTMPAHYGRILRTEGADGDHVDFYMGDNEASETAWVIDQMDAETGRFDEHKVMLGFDDASQAAETYKAGFSDDKGAQRLGGIKKMTVADFKDWLANGDTKKPVTPKATRQDKATQGKQEGENNPPPQESATQPKRPPIGSPEYTLIDAMNDLMDMQAEESAQGMIVDARLASRIEKQRALIKRMEEDADLLLEPGRATPVNPDLLNAIDDTEEGQWWNTLPDAEKIKVLRAAGIEKSEGKGINWGIIGAVAKQQILMARDQDALRDKNENKTTSQETDIPTDNAADAVGFMAKVTAARDAGTSQHVTKRGKKLRGHILRDVTKEEAQKVDQYTFRKDDGYFVREKDVEAYVGAKSNQVPVKTVEIPEKGFVRPGYERTMVDGYPSTTQTRLTDDGYVVKREVNRTTVLGPEGRPIFTGDFDVDESAVEAAISKARDRRADASPKPTTEQSADDILDAAFDDVFGEEPEAEAALDEPAAPDRVRQQTTVPDPETPDRDTPRTASEAAQSAASNVAEGVGNIVDGLNALFGDPNKLSSGLTFDAETYAKAKPMFIAAVRAFGAAGQDVMDMAKAMVRGLSANGLTRDAQENMRPYLTRFITDMRDGEIDPFAEEVQTPPESDTITPDEPESPDEQLGNQESDQGEPEGQEPEGGMGPIGEPDGQPADDGRREGDEDSAGEPAGDDADGSLGNGPGSVSDGPVDERQGRPAANFIITDDFALGEGTDGQKLAANIEALRLVRTLETENRYATPEEQATLARWVGWGGLKTVFDGKHEGTTTQWGRAQAELKELLSSDEYVAAMRSTNDAHYTSRTVVKAMWRAMRNFGFDGGRALEPTIGSGNFLGLQPADLSENTEWHAAELDPTTGKIAKHLYPQAQVFDGMGFQDAPFRRAAFDVAIGNPPFGSTQIGNKKLHPDLGKMKVHNFIIAKTGQLLREGGVMSMVVTHRFLDTPNPEARTSLAPDFRFLGAIRLPNTAFDENANTEVTTDIVFFQKRREGETDNDTTWLETGAEGPNGTRLNRYFANNPDMILGRAAMDGTMYAGGRKEGGKGEFTVHSDGRDLGEALNEAVDRIEATIPPREQALEDATTARENSSSLPYGSIMLAKDGRIFRGDEDAEGNRVVQEVTKDSFWKDNAEAQGRVVEALRAAMAAKSDGAPMAERIELEQEARDAALDAGLIDLAGDPVKQGTKYETALADNLTNLLFSDTPRKDAIETLDLYSRTIDRKRLGTDGFERLSAMLNLRQRTRELIAMERADGPADKIEARRRGLRNNYRKFQRKYGYLNNSKNEAILRGDVGPEFALEIGYKAANRDGRKETAKEAPILEKRVIYPYKLPDNVESVADGLHVSMQERGYVDPALIADLTNKTAEEVVKELASGSEPLAFRNPKTGHYEIAEIYLSGNLAEKIKAAEEAGLYQNVPHLKNAMPPPKTQDQITPSIRSMWMPSDVFKDFLKAMGYSEPNVVLMESVGMASVDAGGTGGLTEFGQQFQTERMNPDKIFEHAIKGKIPVVSDTVKTADGTKTVKNEPATREAVAAYERMSREFPDWAYANPERAAQITNAFNEKMNVVTERQYQGVRYLRMVGNSPEIDLRNSQKNGAWRMVQDKVTLQHHVVGAGKTFTAIAGVMERKRMGLSRKAVIAVPNHLTGQWGREWLELYPAANILVPTEKDFSPANRSKLINRIATGDFDAVIIGHSQLTKIENDPEISEKYISDQITELNSALQEAKRSGESRRTVGQIGTRLNNLTDKLKTLQTKLAERSDERLIDWKGLGVDYLVVDEAHLFKNLEYTTTASQLVGMNPAGGSQRAFDMLMKVRTLQDMQGGGVSFLTGTPVSNSLVEIYSMMKYLIPESLESMGIQSFDSWKAAFIQDESRFEYTASMQLKERNIMSGMINLGPLAQLYRSFADIVMRPDVERMFTEQMEARNANEPDPAKQVPTRFPTPKIKGGERRISLAPPTPKMQEFVRYLVMRMAGIKANKSNKDYMSTDNALWVLTDARKASVDIRTIDPTLGREEGSKVERASDEVFRIWKENTERKGAQMVFSDMSAPTKAAEVDAKRIIKAAYEKIGIKGAELRERIAASGGKSYAERWGDVVEEIENIISSPDTSDKKRDSLSEFAESEAVQDASAAMFTADTGFSFYDDMRAALIEKGVPEKEIAFIHDYNTTAKKAQLFEAVNEGNIRVLIGSTQKMGAGTNAQKRLVALHHIDAPWRPSDMEQREGRIIRQGNLFYQQDPEGFEIEIVAYSTEQTADVVQWQVLERKAASIETFLNAATDSIIEEGGDADQYAEFMAQSTGKEVFLQKMQAEKDRDTERAQIASALRMVSEADQYLASYDQKQRLYSLRAETFGKVSHETIGEGAETYLSAWEATVAEYRAEKARVEVLREEVRSRNKDKPRKAWEKLPELPAAPSRWEEKPASGYERKVHDALSRAQSTGQEVAIPLGDGFSVQIHAKAEGGGVTSYAPYLVPPNNREVQGEIRLIDGWGTIDAKDFRRSDKLLNAVSPANITSRAKERAERAARDQKYHADLREQMEDIKSRGVDMEPVNAAEARLARLSALVRIEEVKFASETATAEPNYFAVRDNKGRDLIADDAAQPLTGQFQFTNAGQTYASEWGAPNGTRRIEGTDRTGAVAFFEAENMDTGEQVIVEAIQTQKEDGEKPAEWDVLNVYDAPPPESDSPKVKASRTKQLASDFDAASRDTITSAPEARKAMRKVRKALRDELRKVGISSSITLDIRESVIEFPGLNPMDGYFLDGVVGISADTPGGYMGVMRHEIIHALRSPDLWGGDHGLFTKSEWQALVRAARQNKRLMDQVSRDYADLSQTDQIEEVIAEMFREWSETKDTQGVVGRAFEKLNDIITAVVKALRGQNMPVAADVFESIRTGEIGGRGPDGPGEAVATERLRAKVATPRDAGRISVQTRNLRAGISQLASDAVTNAMKDRGGYNTLGFVPGRALFKELGKGITAAQRYLALKEKMDTKRNDKHAETDVVAQKWRKLANQGPKSNAEMMQIMHDATIAGADPSESFTPIATSRDPQIIAAGRKANPIAYEAAVERVKQDTKRQAAYDDLVPRFRALPRAFRELFVDVRDTYRKLDEEQIEAILGNVERAMTLAVRRAEREHRRTVETAEKNHQGTLNTIAKDDSLTGTQKATRRSQAKMKLDETIKEADDALEVAKATRSWSKDSQVRKLRLQFESNRVAGPYFPLARFGEYFVLARDEEGNVQSFSRHETVQQQRTAQKEMEAEGLEVQIGVMQETDARDLVDPAFVADIERMLEEVNADEKLMDDIWQRWLETLPDMSIRKHRIHRKNREGYDADALRAFGSHMFHGSHQLARLIYSLEMQEELDIASEEAAGSDDPVRKGFIVNEMKRRHAFTMNPKGAWWASRATSLAFVYYLSVSPAAAIVNLSQTSIVGTAVLGRYGGTRKAAGALTKALHDFTRSPNWHSEKNTRHLSAQERDAMGEAYKRGIIDRTQSHDLAQVAESGVEYNAKWVNVMSKVSWLFHHSERMNREVTFLAGYRLMRAQGMDHDTAITRAGDATWETHFDYQNTSKPRIMQSPGMQVLLTFRNFSVNLLWRIFRDLHQSVNAKDAKARKEARRQAAMMATMMLFHAGIKGMYGYGIVMALLGMFFPDDEDNPEERLEKIMFDYLPRPVVKAMLDGVPGTLAGIDLTSRIGMPNLWFREPLRPLEGADLYQHYVNEVLGPIPAIGMNVATGASRVVDGAGLRDGSLIWRGVETAMPKAVRDVMKSGRYAYEGALTYSGDPIKGDFSAFEIIAQASGFTPKELSSQYEQNSRLKNKEQAILDRRKNVIKQVAEQIKGGDGATPRQLRLIEDFNRDYPEYPITWDTINRSVQGRVQRSARNEAGVQVNPRLDARLRGSLSALVASE